MTQKAYALVEADGHIYTWTVRGTESQVRLIVGISRNSVDPHNGWQAFLKESAARVKKISLKVVNA